MKKTIQKTTGNGIKIDITVSCPTGSTVINVCAYAPEFGYSNGLVRERAFFKKAPAIVVAMIGPKVGLTVDDLARVDAVIDEITTSDEYQARVAKMQAAIAAEAPARAKRDAEMADYYAAYDRVEKAMSL